MARVRRWVVAAGVALLVTGCSADPKPRLSEPSETPAVTSTPSPTASAEPEPWEVRSQAGAVAFVNEWVKALNAAFQSGDTAQVERRSSPECELCAAFTERLDRIQEAGGFYRSEGWRVLQTAPVTGLPKDQASVVIRVQVSGEEVRETDQSGTVRNPPTKATWSLRLEWGRGWTVTELELVQ